MPRPTKYLADVRQWDLERFALPMLLAFVNVQRPNESWDAWTAVPPASRPHWTIRGGAFTDDYGDWLREAVLADLEALRASIESPDAGPLWIEQAHVQMTARLVDGRVEYLVTTKDLEHYFRFALLEAVRQGVHLRIRPCAACHRWALVARTDSRFCSRACRVATERRSPDDKRRAAATRQRDYYARTASVSKAPHLQIARRPVR